MAVGALALAELFHYLVRGRRPGRLGARFVVCVGLVVVVVAAQVTGQLRLLRTYPPAAAGLLCVLLIPGLRRAYGQTTRALHRWLLRLLLCLRLLAVSVVLALLTRPVVEYVTITRERGTLAVLVDDSRSMGVRDVLSDPRSPEASSMLARAEVVESTWQDHREALAALASDLNLRYFRFDASIDSLAELKFTVKGEQTALAGAIEQVRSLLEAEGGKPVGILVISDGRDNLSSEEEQRSVGDALAARGVPLYAVGVGSELPVGQSRGILARRLDCPESVALLNRLPAQAEFVATGLAGKLISVELLWDDAVVEAQQVRPALPTELLRVNLGHTPIAGGLHRVAVRARVQEGAQGRDDASLAQFVRVTDEKIQVLYMDRPRYERAAIARALEAATELRVTKVDLSRADAEGRSPGLPRSAAEWQAYHVVLIGDVDRGAFSATTLSAIRDLVIEQGRGAAMLGGVRTLGAGPYGNSPLAGLVPVSLGQTGQLDAPVAFELTPAGRQHAVCRLQPQAAAALQLWTRLPPFNGAARLSGLAPTAEVLMRTPGGDPLVVVSEAGRGRAAAIAFDSTWRWSFAEDRGGEAQKRFWRQLALWLANRKPVVWVAADRPRYDLTRLRSNVESIVLRGGVNDPTTGQVPENAALTGSIRGPDGRGQELHWVRTGEAMEARPSVLLAGEYHVRVKATAGGKPLGESETAFEVVVPDPELADPTADLENLRRLAARTRADGGEYVSVEALGGLLNRLAARRHITEIRQVRRENLVDERPWTWFGVFVGLLAVEWIIRRRAGLV